MLVKADQQLCDSVGKYVDLIVEPVGVVSLAHAVLSHYKSHGGGTTILAVEPNNAVCLRTSLVADQITTISTRNTTMCGMNCGTVSHTACQYMCRGIDACLTVNDGDIRLSQDMLRSLKIDVDPCTAATYAALTWVRQYEKGSLGLSEDCLIVLLTTEGPR